MVVIEVCDDAFMRSSSVFALLRSSSPLSDPEGRRFMFGVTNFIVPPSMAVHVFPSETHFDVLSIRTILTDGIDDMRTEERKTKEFVMFVSNNELNNECRRKK